MAVAPDSSASPAKREPNTNSPAPRSGQVLLIAPARSYRVASYLRAAERLGYRLLIVSDSEHSLIPAIAAGITIDFHQPEQAFACIRDAIRTMDIVAVIPTDDLVVTLASRVAQYLGLPHNDPESSRLTRRKDLARERLVRHACNTPDFRVCGFHEVSSVARKLVYPVVLKPLMLSGSRGVIRANNTDEFEQAATEIRHILRGERGDDYERHHFLVENYLDGDEVAIDGFVTDGEFRLLALFDKPEPLIGPCFEESYYITPSRHSSDTQQAIVAEIARCCTAYGLHHGPIHAEARITQQGVVLIEMASRTIGGQCARVIEYVLGTGLEELVLRLMCRDRVDLEPEPVHAGVLMIPITRQGVLKRVEGMLCAQQVAGITDIEIHIQPGYELIPLPRGASYLGFIFARAEGYDSTFRALRESYQCLEFVTGPKWEIETAAG